VEGSCEHGNEPSGSIKFWEVVSVASQLVASQEGLSSMMMMMMHIHMSFVQNKLGNVKICQDLVRNNLLLTYYLRKLILLCG
jgi:hypothetical protein